MENMLGVLGGMGPLASQLLYKMITEKTVAEKDQDHIDMMILNHATMPDRTRAILSGDTARIYDMLLEDCRILERAGCRAIVIACNTAHYFSHQFEASLRIPLISMVREAAKEMGLLHKGRPWQSWLQTAPSKPGFIRML
jgi:aspartate racemase